MARVRPPALEMVISSSSPFQCMSLAPLISPTPTPAHSAQHIAKKTWLCSDTDFSAWLTMTSKYCLVPAIFFVCNFFSNCKATLAVRPVPSRAVGVFFGISRPVPLGIFYFRRSLFLSRRVSWRLFPQSITDGDADAAPTPPSFPSLLASFPSFVAPLKDWILYAPPPS